MSKIREDYADPRRTVIISSAAGNVQADDFLGPREVTWVTLTSGGVLSRSFENKPPKITSEIRDAPLAMVASNTAHTLYLITTSGETATVPVKLIQQAHDPAQGVPFPTLCPLTKDAQIAYVLSLPPELEEGYLAMLTEQGEVKRLRLVDVPGLSANTFKLMDVEPEDRLLWAGCVNDESEMIVVTYQAQAIRFKMSEVRPTGLSAGGMRAVKLMGQRDRVIGAGIAADQMQVWVITDTGVAKSSPVQEYPTQGRAGSGVITMKLPKDAGGLAAAVVGQADDQIVVVTDKGKPKSMRINAAPQSGRNTKGDYVISMGAKESVARVIKPQERVELPEAASEETITEA
ncbi:MAG TPA: DNA gyrase C-terminal beta-propeller domain-containing protein [Aggregatilineaceae bacterium]|nr:DNA gyrase C-terminal beta-propeller domain-containing protein [Aggregatilineaceae bacterium]